MKYILAVSVTLVLTACDRTPVDADRIEPRDTAREAQQESTTDAEVPRQRQSTERAEPASQPVEPERPPLDLRIPPVTDFQDEEPRSFEQQSILPELFDVKDQKKKTSVRVDLISDPENPDYIDALEGATISIDVPIPGRTRPTVPGNRSEQ